jgi:hypothetical protein
LHQPLVVAIDILRELILEFHLAVYLLQVRFELHHLDHVVKSLADVEMFALFIEFIQLDLGPVDQVM